MRIILHIGLETAGATALQLALAAQRDALAETGVLFPRAPGAGNHTRLFMAITDPDHVDPLRFNRGHITAQKQAALRSELCADLAAEIARHRPHTLILSAAQLAASLHRPSELERLHELLAPLSDAIRVVAHVGDPADQLARHYGAQVLEGRAAPLDRDLALAAKPDWWKAALATLPPIDPRAGQFEETQGAPFWLDYAALQRFWEAGFGAGAVRLRPYLPDRFAGPGLADELRLAFGLESLPLKVAPAVDPPPPSAAWLTRSRLMNALLLELLQKRRKILPRPLWRSFLSEFQIDGPALEPGSLAAISARFAPVMAQLAGRDPGFADPGLAPPAPLPNWTEAAPELGFRPSQYLLAFMYRIDKATREERKAKAADLAELREGLAGAGNTPADPPTDPQPAPALAKAKPARAPGTGSKPALPDLSPQARAVMPKLAIENFERLKGSPYAPHNRLGVLDEETPAPAYAPADPRVLAPGRSGNVIVGCMKNEAPYILEWVAYHRAIGVDNFLIYTNGCEDGTDEILDRLQELGLLQHRLNDDWKGNSPQQYALNRSLKEPLIRTADWIIHIDVDEFINVRCGNGTLQDFLDRVPGATNVAMTWRLFGHNGVHKLDDDQFVIAQFDACAPKFCPKPHTVWGFKTMFRNIGAYEKISCHRPNKLADDFRDKVRWVNGSGQDMTREAAVNGWRNSKKSIGYDLLQLNHYALRSAESFLIKRQRGRALHVDRSIGLNYWIRMDWGDHRDVTIQRNLPRLQAEFDRLLADPVLADWHARGQAWHRAKADELHGVTEFADLYAQALDTRLTGMERVAYALALDMES